MTLSRLACWAKDMNQFYTLDDYSSFCESYLQFISNSAQTVLVAQNDPQYFFFQYQEAGNFNITRPMNRQLMIPFSDFFNARENFYDALEHIHQIGDDWPSRSLINQFVYTCQQSIGAALDALPSGESNFARKIHGELFERYVRLILREIGIPVDCGKVSVPVMDGAELLCEMTYQHDLILGDYGDVWAIGSVKTSSKDRLDKIFIDKFMYNRLTGQRIPHFAVFLNDVQRTARKNGFGVNTTFLAGHFKGYTVKLNPLDGVYYCDLRPSMYTDPLLRSQIRSFDYLLTEDIWSFLQ